MADQAISPVTHVTPAKRNLLTDLAVSDCVQVKPIYEIHSSWPLSAAIDIMAHKGVSSLPMYSSDDGGKKVCVSGVFLTSSLPLFLSFSILTKIKFT
jgi:hypothetical protein